MPPPRPRTRSGTEFVDSQIGSPSFALISKAVEAAFSATADSPRTRALSRGTTGLTRQASPVLLSYLAHQLGKSTLKEPALLRDRQRALLVGWEIEELTDDLAEELGCGDVLLGISGFNSDVFRHHYPSVPVITVPVPIPSHSRPAPDRARWGIPEGSVAFLNVFNPVSGFDRKNPIDAYDAFVRAFPDRDDVRMVFKAHGGFAKQPDEGDLTGEEERATEFLARCASDDRVILIDDFMPYDDVATLVSSCDVYVSLARAEGLGLPVLEAMSLGVPTICMDYSGHADFVTDEGSLLVPYDLIDIPDDASHYYNPTYYSRRPRWAQPRLDDAARMMRRLAEDGELRQRLSSGALEAARAYQRRCDESTWLADLERTLASPELAERHAEKEREFQRVARRDRDEWLDHGRRVRRARRVLAVRTRLGRLKRRVTDAVRLGHGL